MSAAHAGGCTPATSAAPVASRKRPRVPPAVSSASTAGGDGGLGAAQPAPAPAAASQTARSAASATASSSTSSGSGHSRGAGALAELIAAGVVAPGDGVLKVHWWGVELPPAANLSPTGDITLPDGVGPKDATYTPTALLVFLAKHNRLFGFTKGNGWAAVSYGGKKLTELRGPAPIRGSNAQ